MVNDPKASKPAATVPVERVVPAILKILSAMVHDKAHGQITITVRGGNVQLISETRQHLPARLIGS